MEMDINNCTEEIDMIRQEWRSIGNCANEIDMIGQEYRSIDNCANEIRYDWMLIH